MLTVTIEPKHKKSVFEHMTDCAGNDQVIQWRWGSFIFEVESLDELNLPTDLDDENNVWIVPMCWDFEQTDGDVIDSDDDFNEDDIDDTEFVIEGPISVDIEYD